MPMRKPKTVRKKAARKRRPPKKISRTPGPAEVLGKRLRSAEGKALMDQFAKLIAETFIESMSPGELTAFRTKARKKTLKEMWPDIVKAFFERICNPRA